MNLTEFLEEYKKTNPTQDDYRKGMNACIVKDWYSKALDLGEIY